MIPLPNKVRSVARCAMTCKALLRRFHSKRKPQVKPRQEPRLDQDQEQKQKPPAPDLPQTWYYSSNHILINRERVMRGIPPLTRSVELDELARQLAQWGAQGKELTDIHFPEYFSANLLCGYSIRGIHKAAMKDKCCFLQRRNMLNPLFHRFGIATCKRRTDGLLYLCQIFESRRFEI